MKLKCIRLTLKSLTQNVLQSLRPSINQKDQKTTSVHLKNLAKLRAILGIDYKYLSFDTYIQLEQKMYLKTYTNIINSKVTLLRDCLIPMKFGMGGNALILEEATLRRNN